MLPLILVVAEVTLVCFTAGQEQDSPTISIYQKTSLGQPDPVDVDSYGNFELAGNVEEIRLRCESSYPTKWMMVPSPQKDGSNIKEWHIDKGRTAVTPATNMTFWSVVILRFTNNPNRILHQSAVCHHIGTALVNVNVSIISDEGGGGMLNGNLIINDAVSRKMGERFGKNKDCSLIMHLDVEKRRISCESLLGVPNISPDLIQCANADECEASVRQAECSNPPENYAPVQFNSCESKKCWPLGNNTGALICVLGDRIYSVVQIVQFGFNNTLYFPNLSPVGEVTRLVLTALNSTTPQYYNGTRVTFQCTGVMWYFSHGFHFALRIGNDERFLGTGIEETNGREFYSSKINIVFPSEAIGITSVLCIAPQLNLYGWERIALQAEVKQSHTPTLIVTKILDENSGTVMHCTATGEPTPKISWTRSGILLPAEQWNTTTKGNFTISVLRVPRNPGEVENFTCVAMDFLGNTVMGNVQVEHPDFVGLPTGLIIGVSLSVVLLLISVTFGVYWRMRNKFREFERLTEEEIEEFTLGNTQTQCENSPLFYPYNTEYEIPKGKIRFESKILGDGHFGRVTRGKLDNRYVAIKTVKKFSDISYLKALLSELKICCFVGRHEHIVNLIGGCTQNIQNREVYLIYEYCANGNILKYLRKYRDEFVNHLTHDRYTSTRHSVGDYQNIAVKKISFKDLLRWGAEIASGMEFLSDKNIIHGDLAARNVLLTESLRAKVGDFGLSKQLNDYTVYVQKLECPLPLKWMAIESLRDLEFSVKSDIWSYGVTLWEIYTLGQPPYSSLSQFDCSSWKMLQQGYRLEKPNYASEEVYNIMLRCWLEDRESRPTFSLLRGFFEGCLTLVTGRPSLRIH